MFFNILWSSKYPDGTIRDMVQANWDVPVSGHSIYILTQKLKRNRKALKVWKSGEIFGNIKFQVEEESKSLEQMQKHFEQGNMNEEFTMQMVNQENKVEQLLEQERCSRRKRGATDNDNDRSTKFFHAMANSNRSKSMILELKNNKGNTLSTQEDIGEFLAKHYEDKFKKLEHEIDWSLIQNMPQAISDEDNEKISSIPSAQEVRAAVFHLKVDSSPGPDGFTGFFLSTIFGTLWNMIWSSYKIFLHQISAAYGS
ncbi:hypothetical protein IFM89_032250 [Coptis chinensis]|uniref:Uncharacterized protein n=1 Tax=Coptis chinensis TaxID=261450 RepID=A0A835IFH9_9MAGN|nr:hypothetical protein IFM89_032250 [Coptis chinensis]